jgi:hypothetical protein
LAGLAVMTGSHGLASDNQATGDFASPEDTFSIC